MFEPSVNYTDNGFRTAQTIPTGYLTLTITEPNVAVSIDNGQSTFTTPDNTQPVETVLLEGKHILEVSKAGFETFKKDITVAKDGREMVEVRLEAVR